MDRETLTTPPASPPPKRRWATAIILMLFVAVWLLVIVFRMELRSHYWAYQLVHATSATERKPYLVRLAAAEDHALGAIAGLLDNESASVRGDAIYLLGRVDSPRAGELLFDALDDESDSNAWQAAIYLSRRAGQREVASELMNRFENATGRDWEYTAVALGLAAYPPFVDTMIEEAEDAEDPDRLAVLIDALRLSRNERAIPLLESLREDDRSVSITPPSERHILNALTALGPELQQKGIDIGTWTTTTAPKRTIDDLADRAIKMIQNPEPVPTTQPEVIEGDR